MKETEELLAFLNSVMWLDKDTGIVFWKWRNPTELKDRQWNGRFGGKQVGSLRKDGYLRTGFNFQGKTTYVLVHRIVWAFYNGEWPKLDVDHVNQNKSDNLPSNLRLATRPQNIANRKQKSTSEYKGVRFDKRKGSYQARIMFEGKAINLLNTKDPIEAAKAYDAAARKYYGEYADTNFGGQDAADL